MNVIILPVMVELGDSKTCEVVHRDTHPQPPGGSIPDTYTVVEEYTSRNRLSPAQTPIPNCAVVAYVAKTNLIPNLIF